MEVKAPPNFHQPGLADESYIIFVGGRRKLCNFRLVTFIGQGPTEDKMKPTKKVFFRGFWLIFHRPLADGSSAVSCSELLISIISSGSTVKTVADTLPETRVSSSFLF
jgi:hypothetical protein